MSNEIINVLFEPIQCKTRKDHLWKYNLNMKNLFVLKKFEVKLV